MNKGQLSLEALLSISILLAGFAILMASAKSFSSSFTDSISQASQKNSLSYSALCLDTAAYALHGAHAELKQNLSLDEQGFLVAGGQRERLIHRATSSVGGKIYVESKSKNPI
ncbi:MAG: hypothetical protein QW275_00055 [Candidatus Anstonellaceae archaeon]